MIAYNTAMFYLLLLAIALVGRLPHMVRTMRTTVIDSKNLFREHINVVLSCTMIIIPLLHLFTHWFTLFDAHFPFALRFVGGAIFLAAVALHNWTHDTLGIQWSPVLRVKEKHQLVMRGPYKYVRHPLYASYLWWTIGQGLLLNNWLILLTGMISEAIVYLSRRKDEEALLIKQFGKEYKEYMQKTRRIFPKLLRS
ncbi:isoprenylcysteine carboxylmethyltransferase family protein [Candidatus Woesearchaeota archaeon]|nr:isoprenylcysteine carboxylmethyltransferase family protein [Candidatus Woesearchaeota archaeon]